MIAHVEKQRQFVLEASRRIVESVYDSFGDIFNEDDPYMKARKKVLQGLIIAQKQYDKEKKVLKKKAPDAWQEIVGPVQAVATAFALSVYVGEVPEGFAPHSRNGTMLIEFASALVIAHTMWTVDEFLDEEECEFFGAEHIARDALRLLKSK